MVSHLTVHASYEPIDTANAPVTASHFLRERLGDEYVTAGFTFNQGRFNAQGPGEDAPYDSFAVGPAGPEQNEYTLDQVAHDDYLVDLRTVAPEARSWLGRKRPTYNIGGSFAPESEPFRFDIALAEAYDIVIHLDEIQSAELLSH